MADVTMPQLGETVTEGTITRWMKAVGEQVRRDEPLFEVSTDKVDSEVPSPATGVLSEILVPEGETVEVGARLAVIGDGVAGEGAPTGSPVGASGQVPAPPAAPPAAPTPPASPLPPVGVPAEAAPPPAPPPVASPPDLATQAGPAPASPPPAPTPDAPSFGATVRPAPPFAEVAEVAPIFTTPAQDASPVPPPPEGYTAQTPVDPLPAPAVVGAGSGDPRLLSPVVRRLLADNRIDPSEVTGTGVGGRITREDVLAVVDARYGSPTAPSAPTFPAQPAPRVAPVPPPAAVPPTPSPGPAAEPVPSPAEPVAPAAAEPIPSPTAPIPPTAPAAPAESVPPAPAPQTPAPVPQAAPPPPPTPVAPRGTTAQTAPLATLRPSVGDRVVPFSNMRRRTAEHMVRSKATSPHAFIANEVDFENVERVRKAWGERFRAEEGFSLTYLPFVARATVEALRDFPNLNASVADDALVVHQQVNLGIAVDLDHEGLIVPVVHRAEEVTLRGIARRIRDLADRARTRQLTADDISAGTFSITNDGPFGTFFTVPIINQPQVAILATDGIKRRPVVATLPDGSESIAIHSTGVVGMSWDHRAVDGAYVSSFLRRLAELLGTRDWAAEL